MAMGLLASKGIDIYHKSNVKQKNALHLAAERSLKSIVNMLIQSKYRLDEVDSNGFTALIIAASIKDSPHSQRICVNLIKAGAQVNIISKNGQTCLTESVRSDHKALSAYAIKHGAKILFEEKEFRT
mgnify:CR=1 FL=1